MTGHCREQKSSATLPVRSSGVQGRSSGVPSSVTDLLRHGGVPLDMQTQRSMEARFGQDFSSVRVHADDHAARAAESIDARAYTAGRNIVFGAGHYDPRSPAGETLLAHELTHVVQQSGESDPASRQSSLSIDRGAGDPAEREARGVASGALAPGDIGRHPVAINRDGPGGEEEEGFRFRNPDGTPMFQLRLDPLLMPPLPPPQLSLDPQIAIAMRAQALAQAALSPTTIRTAIEQIELGPLIAAPPRPAWLTAPVMPPPAPLVPRGAGPATPRAATASDLLGAVTAVPSVAAAIDRIKSDTLNRLGSGIVNEWNGLNTPGRIIAVSHTALVAGTFLTGILANEPSRNFVLTQLAGRDIPIPGIPMTMQLNLVGPDLGVRFGLNVGALLPPALGFK